MGICLFIALSFITLAPRYIAAYEVEIFFVLETILGPIWVWLFIYEQPTTKTLIGGICIILIKTQLNARNLVLVLITLNELLSTGKK